MSMFAVVAVLLVLSFAFMGLSLLHILRWSDLSNDRKALWAVAVYVGAQPALLIYWYLNVWRRATPRVRRPTSGATNGPRSRASLLLLGVLTVIPPLYFAAFMLMVADTFAGASSGGSAPGWIEWVPTAHVGVIVLWWGLTAFYLVDVFRTPRLEGSARAVWAVVVAFAGPVGWPLYWYLNMWRPAPYPPTGVAPTR